MSHDFAKQRQAPVRNKQHPARAATRTTEAVKSTHWNWFIAGVCVGLFGVGIAYVGIVKLDTEITEATSASTNNGASPTRPTINFGFYDELANAEVEVNTTPSPGIVTEGNVQGRPATDNTQAVAAKADAVRYLLQAGSFQDRQDAESRRARIILLNMDANIVPGIVSGRTWYRVVVGPITGRADAEAAQDVLSESNIDSIRLLTR